MLAKATRGDIPDSAAVRDELERLTESPGLQHAEGLCQLLRYLVEHALANPGEHVKEYQIAIEVFGRPQSFDPRLDSTVRVQTSRLRNKLVEYYATAGTHDAVVIDIPKGSYSAVFRGRHATPVEAMPAIEEVPVIVRPPAAPAKRSWSALVAIGAALVTGLVAGVLIAPLRSPSRPAPLPDLLAFWSSVWRSPQAPLVIFSNAEFKGRPETGLRYFDAQTDSPDHINDLYTGVGEVLAIGEISRVFHLLNRDMVIKRSGLLGWDDTRSRDLIFVGSPTENLSLRDLPLSQEFVFRSMKPGEPRPGDLAIVNEHPAAGEAGFFFASASLPLTEDYAVVTLEPGLHPGQSVVLLAGTTTLGTQAAAEFVCQNDSIGAIRKRIGTAAKASFPPFSAVIRVRVARGVPVESTIAALHVLPARL